MKKFVVAILVVFSVVGCLNAQVYKNVKVNLKNGLQMKGRFATIDNDTITMQTSGVTRTISMNDVNSMMAKSGKAENFAIGCGAGCLGYGVVNLVLLGEDGLRENNLTIPQYVAAYVFFVGASAATGYLIGSLFDPYEVVYIKESSFLNKVKFNVTTDQLALKPIPGSRIKPLSLGTPMLSVSYRF